MNEPTNLGPDQVAALQKKLADAAAEVAQVQAQLNQAGGGAPAPVEGTTTAQTWTQYPQVQINGQTVTGAQPIDLAAMLGQQGSDQLRTVLGQLGSEHGLEGLMAGRAGAAVPSPVTVDRISEPPRHVPFAFRVAGFWALSWWELFTIVMAFVAPIALWGFFPQTIPAALILGLLAIFGRRGRSYVRRVGLLRYGKVATVTNADELSRGTYYSGTTYSNMRIAQATGWDVARRWYSGPASISRIDYTLDGTAGTLKLRGLPYANGVILADSRHPRRSLCVSSFPYSVKPDPNGDLRGSVSAGAWVGILATFVVQVALVAAAVYSVMGLWLHTV